MSTALEMLHGYLLERPEADRELVLNAFLSWRQPHCPADAAGLPAAVANLVHGLAQAGMPAPSLITMARSAAWSEYTPRPHADLVGGGVVDKGKGESTPVCRLKWR